MDERVVRISVCPWCKEKVTSADGRFVHEGGDGFKHVWLDDGNFRIVDYPVQFVDDDSWRAKLKERLEHVKD